MGQRLPDWLKVRLPSDRGLLKEVAGRLRHHGLNTVCTGARCPNLADCWACGTATIMLLGQECTRNCTFCAIGSTSLPPPPDPAEPEAVATAIAELGLRYAVLTSVTRDDLPDGGASHFAQTVRAINACAPQVKVELLIPDLQGHEQALSVIRDAGADVVGHNLETVARLTPQCRDGRASYARSLAVLRSLAERAGGPAIKTSLLLGLGETREEVVETLHEAFGVGTRHIALGQYLAPTRGHTPVARYWSPEEFAEVAEVARKMGYESVASGPLVRSSYRADQYTGKALKDR